MGQEPSSATYPSLLLRIRDAEDAQAWQTFVDTYGPLIYGYSKRRSLQDEDAADVMQQVLLLVHRYIGSFTYDPKRGRFRDMRKEAMPLTFLAPSDDESFLGSMGEYRVVEELGRGGMGVVLKAEDTRLNRTVAIKVLWPDPGEATARQRFVQEARMAAGVHHDNVVTVHAVETPPDGPPYMVMEFVEGLTLRDLIRETGPREPNNAAQICAEVADGLAAAHREKLIHRDVKPSNIILDSATGRAKVADFGLARAAELPSDFTREGRVSGTPEYMSPEQVQSPREVDTRVDVYGLGVTLYESLTGEVPFRGISHMVVQQLLQDEPVTPRQLNDRIPRDLETISLKCLSKDPAHRYQTIDDLAKDLRRWLRNEPIQARPVTPLGRVWKWSRRRPTVAGLLTALILAIVVGFAAVTWQWRDASTARQQAEEERDEARLQRERAETVRSMARTLVDETIVAAKDQADAKKPNIQIFQEDLLNALLRFQVNLDKVSEGDSSTEADRGRTYWWLAVIRSGMGKEKKQQALADTREMEAIFTRLAKQHPEESEYQFLWGWSFGWQASLLRDLKQFDEAEVASEKAITILENAVAKHPSHAGCSVKLGACYLNRARLFVDRGQLEKARANYALAIDQLVKPISPEDARAQDLDFFLRLAGEAAAGMRDWPTAIKVFGKRAKLDPAEPYRQYELAIAFLANGELAAYRQVCADMFAQFHSTNNNDIAARIVYTCVPALDAIPNIERLTALAKMAVNAWPGDVRLCGAVAYRSGDYESAAKFFEEANETDRRAWDWFFMSMTQSRLGRFDEARRCLDEGIQTLNESADIGWTEKIESQCLREEASALIRSIDETSM